jgi:DNA polymerase III delta prime subunit
MPYRPANAPPGFQFTGAFWVPVEFEERPEPEPVYADHDDSDAEEIDAEVRRRVAGAKARLAAPGPGAPPMPEAAPTVAPAKPQSSYRDKLAERIYEQRDRKLIESDSLRPTSIDDVVGQRDALEALLGIMSSGSLTHVILTGPPGSGKTSLANLGMQLAKATGTLFSDDAPFVSVDCAGLHTDRTNNILALRSVVIPSFYSSQRDRNLRLNLHTDTPEIELGCMAKAHLGILFLDELGELPREEQGREQLNLRSSLAFLDHANTPQWMREFCDQARGIPASFMLIGATSRDVSELDQALVSRAEVIQFKDLSETDREEIVLRTSLKLGVDISDEAVSIIAAGAKSGRDASRRTQLAAGIAARRDSDAIEPQDIRFAPNASRAGFRS